MHGINLEVLLASGYAIFLASVAAVLEFAARHSHERTRRIPTVGFSYHPELDFWKCPNDKHLYRVEVMRESSAVRYQADSWLQSELRKFHRALSLTLLLLADFILVVTMLRQNNMRDQLILAVSVLCITGAGFRIFSNFFQLAEGNPFSKR
jgi:hypothetical protein